MGARCHPEEIRRAVESERPVHRNVTTGATIAQITAPSTRGTKLVLPAEEMGACCFSSIATSAPAISQQCRSSSWAYVRRSLRSQGQFHRPSSHENPSWWLGIRSG